MTKNHDPHISAKRVCSYSLRSRQPNLHRAPIFLLSICNLTLSFFRFWQLYIFHEILPYWFWSPKTTIHTFRLNDSDPTRHALDNQTFTARLSFCFRFFNLTLSFFEFSKIFSEFGFHRSSPLSAMPDCPYCRSRQTKRTTNTTGNIHDRLAIPLPVFFPPEGDKK